MKRSAKLVWSALLLLISAIGLVTYGSLQVPTPTFHGNLRDLLPPPPPGWTVKDKPIADSPEMKEAVAEILNFDDGVLVEYTQGTTRLSVYIAHWQPGRMSHRLIAGHTPDVCWVNGGWKKISAERLPPQNTADGRPIPAGERRIFSANGTEEHVWFWHMVGVLSKSYQTGDSPPWYAALTDLWERGLNQRDEQFFIRLSSNLKIEELNDSPILNNVLARIPWPPASSS